MNVYLNLNESLDDMGSDTSTEEYKSASETLQTIGSIFFESGCNIQVILSSTTSKEKYIKILGLSCFFTIHKFYLPNHTYVLYVIFQACDMILQYLPKSRETRSPVDGVIRMLPGLRYIY